MRLTIATALLLAVAGWLLQDTIYALGVRLLGPPRVTMAEAYADAPTTAPAEAEDFDHARFDRVVKAHVDDAGWVDYAALAADTTDLDAYIASLATADFDALGRDGKLALLINAYNAFTLRLIVDYYDDGELKSIRDIPEARRWDDVRWDLAGKRYSLNQIEHEWVRKRFKEPRIHFALVCAAESCPILRNEAYTASKLDAQLAAQSAYTHTHPRWLRYDAEKDRLELTRLYQWYAGDFEQAAGSVLKYVAQQSPAVKRALDAGRTPIVGFLDYAWRLNDKRFKP